MPDDKKKDPTDKENYRPVSILHLLSKVYKKVLYRYFYEYMDNCFSLLQPLQLLLCYSSWNSKFSHNLFCILKEGKTTLLTSYKSSNSN